MARPLTLPRWWKYFVYVQLIYITKCFMEVSGHHVIYVQCNNLYKSYENSFGNTVTFLALNEKENVLSKMYYYYFRPTLFLASTPYCLQCAF